MRINFINSPKKIGPKRKLESKDEFFIMLIKLKIRCVVVDLADRFGISAAHCRLTYNC